MTRCKSCGAAIRWVLSATTGRRMPLDAEPSDAGNVTVDQRMRGPTATVWPAGEPPPADLGPRYVSHFATCPNARRHRAEAKAQREADAIEADALREMGVDPRAGRDVGAK